MGDVTPIGAGRSGVLEFLAGIGLARMGLEAAGFRVVWANDYEPDKKAMYDAQFGESDAQHFALGDVGEVRADDLPRDASLAWAHRRARIYRWLVIAQGSLALSPGHSGISLGYSTS